MDLIRWRMPFARVAGSIGAPDAAEPSRTTVEVVLPGPAMPGERKRIRVNGVPRNATALAGLLRTVLFAPEDMLLVVGGPKLRRDALDTLAGQRFRTYLADSRTYLRTLQQRNSLLKAIRDEGVGRDQLGVWDAKFLEVAVPIVESRLRLLEELADPLARAHAEIAPEEAAAGRLTLGYVTNAPAAPGESVGDALARRLRETADKEVWNGSTLIGPHRDDLSFALSDRDLASFASRGQQRTAILALKLAELDLLTALDGEPPLLLLDDVFSELDPDRRGHLVRRIAVLPQAFVTTTTLDDLDAGLRHAATSWAVGSDDAGAAVLAGPTAGGAEAAMSGDEGTSRDEATRAELDRLAADPDGGLPAGGRGRRRPMARIGDLIPEAARRLGLDEELRLARAVAAWSALVEELVPAASGACRLVGILGGEALVEADHPIVAQELRLRERELVGALSTALGSSTARLRVTVRRV